MAPARIGGARALWTTAQCRAPQQGTGTQVVDGVDGVANAGDPLSGALDGMPGAQVSRCGDARFTCKVNGWGPSLWVNQFLQRAGLEEPLE
jgi:hypothetical protein